MPSISVPRSVVVTRTETRQVVRSEGPQGPPGVGYPEPWLGTQAEYNALGTYDPDRFYIIT